MTIETVQTCCRIILGDTTFASLQNSGFALETIATTAALKAFVEHPPATPHKRVAYDNLRASLRELNNGQHWPHN